MSCLLFAGASIAHIYIPDGKANSNKLCGRIRMKAIVYEGIKNVKVKNIGDTKIINNDDIIVKVTSTAICGSDLHLIHGMVPNK
ncbi:hypothetical protein OXPF_42300 [Oxobacter pfennigii]|uniref:Uncharacterized protein n=1 Tax=Oxobacter pfennigii TaxID=36849 RepID=A0A0P8WW18_9CLOT|nr:hypothetical protein OXPF_42300 [Oxobacter pfennigii]